MEWLPLPSRQLACSGVTPCSATLAGTNHSFWVWVVRNCSSKILLSVAGFFSSPLTAPAASNKARQTIPFFISSHPSDGFEVGKNASLVLNTHLRQEIGVIKGHFMHPVITAGHASMPSGIHVGLQDQRIVVRARGSHFGHVFRRLPIHHLAVVE